MVSFKLVSIKIYLKKMNVAHISRNNINI